MPESGRTRRMTQTRFATRSWRPSGRTRVEPMVVAEAMEARGVPGVADKVEGAEVGVASPQHIPSTCLIKSTGKCLTPKKYCPKHDHISSLQLLHNVEYLGDIVQRRLWTQARLFLSQGREVGVYGKR